MTDRPSIEAVLDHYGVVGRRKKVSCPLHEDRTPSCSIDYTNDLWRCHSCGKGGTSWDLIMQIEGLSFADAVELVQTTGLAGEGGSSVKPTTTGSIYGSRRTVARGAGQGRKQGGGYTPSWRRG